MLTDFNVDAGKFYEEKFRSESHNNSTKGQVKYVDYQLANVNYQFTRRYQALKKYENPEEAQLSTELFKNAQDFASSSVEMIILANESVLEFKQNNIQNQLSEVVKVKKNLIYKTFFK